MKFVLLAAPLRPEGGGMTLFRSFYNYLNSHSEHDWVFLLGNSYVEESRRVKVLLLPKIKENRIRRLIFDFLTGRRVINQLQADVIFSFQNTCVWGSRAPQIIYLDQPVPFQKTKRFSFFKKEERSMAVYQYLIGSVVKASVRKASMIVVQTQWMKRAVMEQCRVPEERIVLVPPEIDLSCLKQAPPAGEYQTDRFFYPASDVYYKNHRCIYAACQRLQKENIPLTMSVTVCQSGPANVEFLGQIPYQEVLERLRVSTLVFPSYVETYGLPLLEARRLNSIILAADTEFSRELLDGYNNAYFFDYRKPDELAGLMRDVATGKIVRKENPVVIGEAAVGEDWKRLLAVFEEVARSKKA